MAPPPEDGLSALGKAKKRLYAPKEDLTLTETPLRENATSAIQHGWSDRLSLQSFGAPHHVRFASKFFIGALCFFALAIGISAFLLYTGGNTVSVNNIELTVQGPTTIAGGDTLPLSIVVTNKNPSQIEEVTLDVSFPEGTRSATNLTAPYPRFSADLGTLAPGQTVERSVSAVLFGSEGAESSIQVQVSFGTSRSNATFEKRMVYPVVISTAPLSVSVDTVSETVSGKPFTITATVRSNATAGVDGVVLAAQYPAGYVLSDSSIPPVGTNFLIGTLKPGASKVVTLTGTLQGQDNDMRVFHFTVGTAKSTRDPSLAVKYMTQEASIRIAAPFLTTALIVNGSAAATPAVAPGSAVAVGVNWANALSTSLSNAEIDITISGNGFDPTSVQVQRGFYRSTDHTIILSQDTEPSLALLSPGASGSTVFNFNTLANAPRNSVITLVVSIAGQRLGQSGVPEQVSGTTFKTINLVSAVSLNAASLHSSGPFSNTGPIPPAAGMPTSYAVKWSVVNAGNDLADAIVTAQLPTYITYAGVTSVADGSITYNDSSHIVTWRVGDMAGGGKREGAFQVVLTPSTTQHGSSPQLTGAPTLTAFDRFAKVQVKTVGAAVTTETPGDPGYTPSKATVQ